MAHLIYLGKSRDSSRLFPLSGRFSRVKRKKSKKHREHLSLDWRNPKPFRINPDFSAELRYDIGSMELLDHEIGV